MKKKPSIQQLMAIPGVGRSIAQDLINLGISSVKDLKGKNPEELFFRSNRLAGRVQDRCLLYVFRCAVYYAKTRKDKLDPEKLKWWHWKDRK
ncbi:MAG: pathogenicity locus [Candidatus Aureabacteria bacterium]|nr:pathogenicity locus [Candidatus Auribacterota bacterium]